MDQADRWNDLYRTQRRTWRGVTDLGELPFPPGSRILEAGCGNGKTLEALADAGYEAVGIDFSDEAVRACRELLGDKADAVCASILDMPFGDSEFDGALLYHVLENISAEDVPVLISELGRVVKDDGIIKVRVFAVGDLRSEKGERVSEDTVVRGNGIRYRYFTEDSLRGCFPGCECVSICTVTEDTRFGALRSRIEAVFRL